MPKSKAVIAYEDFQKDLSRKEDELAAMLPPNITRERFLAAASSAVRQNLALVNCDRRSLMNAITKSAQDGVMPDGREGVIVSYREKQKDNSWKNIASWNPMTFGQRKRAWELDKIRVSANVVFEHDHFKQVEGDEPSIEHLPAELGNPRGRRRGAYAIFKDEDGNIIHREVMPAEDIERTRQQSKQPDGLMWAKFTDEAWKKTVVRRGFKSVPCSTRLETIVRRDDELFYMEDEPQGTDQVKPQPVKGKRKPPPTVGEEDLPDDGGDDGEAETMINFTDSDGIETAMTPQAWIERFKTDLEAAETVEGLDAVWDRNKGNTPDLAEAGLTDAPGELLNLYHGLFDTLTEAEKKAAEEEAAETAEDDKPTEDGEAETESEPDDEFDPKAVLRAVQSTIIRCGSDITEKELDDALADHAADMTRLQKDFPDDHKAVCEQIDRKRSRLKPPSK